MKLNEIVQTDKSLVVTKDTKFGEILKLDPSVFRSLNTSFLENEWGGETYKKLLNLKAASFVSPPGKIKSIIEDSIIVNSDRPYALMVLSYSADENATDEQKTEYDGPGHFLIKSNLVITSSMIIYCGDHKWLIHRRINSNPHFYVGEVFPSQLFHSILSNNLWSHRTMINDNRYDSDIIDPIRGWVLFK